MIHEPTKKQLRFIPPMYSTDCKKPEDIVIYLHFYIFASAWYVSEYDPETETFYGFTVLNSEPFNAHWGPFSFESLKKINVNGTKVTCDRNWKPTKAIEIKTLEYRIRERLHENCCSHYRRPEDQKQVS